MLTVEKVLTFDDVFAAINERFFVQSASTRNHWIIAHSFGCKFEIECDLEQGWVQVSEVLRAPATYSGWQKVGDTYRGTVEGVIEFIEKAA